MIPEDRRDADPRIAWAEAELADPWRILRMLEAGFTVEQVAVDTSVLRAYVRRLRRRERVGG